MFSLEKLFLSGGGINQVMSLFWLGVEILIILLALGEMTVDQSLKLNKYFSKMTNNLMRNC